MGLPPLKKPCAECPFSRDCRPGKDLGGASPTTFIGQALGPFVIACHMDPKYKQSTAIVNHEELHDCAGTAIYRANNEYYAHMPLQLHELPPDAERVFASPAEFLAHHVGSTLQLAQQFLARFPPTYWFKLEMMQLGPGNFLRPAKKGTE